MWTLLPHYRKQGPVLAKLFRPVRCTLTYNCAFTTTLTCVIDFLQLSCGDRFGQSIVVKVTDLCPVSGNQQWCGQKQSSPSNSFGMPVQYVVLLRTFFYLRDGSLITNLSLVTLMIN
jgi:hypothetical protein